MSYFYVQACRKGHFQITNKKLKPDAVCDTCGLPLMDRCPECGEYIKKWTLYGATPILPGKDTYQLPAECGRCRSRFPWREAVDGKQSCQKAENPSGKESFPETEDFGGRKSLREGMRPDSQALLQDMHQANGEAALVRKAYDEAAQREYDSCSYAFFPGCQLGAAEPEIVIKAYDSIRFQHPDTAMFLQCCGFAANMAGDPGSFQAVLGSIEEKWNALGRPTMIMACPACQRIFQAHLPDIPVASLYEMLRDMGISGGCHSEDYIFAQLGAKSVSAPDTGAKPSAGGDSITGAVQALAEDMGVKLHSAEEAAEYPHIVCSVNLRDQLKREGKEAVHILELIFGMGKSNLHLEHTHDHGHEEGCHEYTGAHGNAGDPVQADMMERGTQQDGRDGASFVPETESGLALKMEFERRSAPLPSPAERQQNRLELKQALLEFFWNESCE